MNHRFASVLTPFAPQYRSDFFLSLGKPSATVLQVFADKLRDTRHALETYFRHLEALKTEHLRCLDAMRIAERSHVSTASQDDWLATGGEDDEYSDVLDTVNAQQYEDAQRSWEGFLTYAKDAPPLLQIGFLLVDQRQFIAKLHEHASLRIGDMDQALPGLYKAFLRDILHEIDGKIEKVTKIPTSFEDANVWLTHVMEMLPSHSFRQRFDAKCANLAKLQALLQERQPSSSLLCSGSDGDDGGLRKLEREWESTFETLMVCLSRVQNRDSEHRRSFYDLTAKTDEYLASQLDSIRSEFEAIPMSATPLQDATTIENPLAAKRREKELSTRKDNIVEKLENLVELEIECKRVERQFSLYEREYRAITEYQQTGLPFSMLFEGNEEPVVAELHKLPSELLLQHVVTAFDLRKWFDSWNKLVDKWETSPLSTIHPGMVMNRIRQFRRRLLYASSRLFRPGLDSSGKSHEDVSFLSKDLELASDFDQSIERMVTNCRVFQAVSGGSFSEERWEIVDEMLQSLPSFDKKSESRNQFTLRLLKEHWGDHHQPQQQQMDTFRSLCDQVIVESKVHMKMVQAQQRLAQLTVSIVEENYNIRCGNIQDVLVELEDVLLGVKLYLHEQNPELDVLLSVCGDIENKLMVCEQIQCFQSKRLYLCEMAKLHDTDEFFTNRTPYSPTKLGASGGKAQNESLQWAEFKNASHMWNDRIRRAFCRNVSNLRKDTSAGTKSATQRNTVGVVSKLPARDDVVIPSQCSLDDIVTAFDGFDFDQNAISCEAGAQLLREYFNSLREIAPRLYTLSDDEFLQLALRENDCKQVKHSLSICFPHVDAFMIGSNSVKRGDEAQESNSGSVQKVSGSEVGIAISNSSIGPIVIRGVEGTQLPMQVEFRLAVLKIGRVKFWFCRLEEEMTALVTSQVRKAVQSLLGDGNSDPVAVALAKKNMFQTMIPQSIVLALSLRFRYHVDQAIIHYQQQQQQDHSKPNKVFDELKSQTEQSIEMLILLLKDPPAGLTRADPRVETVMLLCSSQLHLVRHMMRLLRQGQYDNALLFWRMQLKVGIAVEDNRKSMTKSSKTGLDSKVQGFQFGEARSSMGHHDNGSLNGVLFHAQIAHLELAIGHEYVGCNRLAIVTPFTERCVYAIFSAMKAHSLAMMVPYTSRKQHQGQFSLLTSISQLLMRPSFTFCCGPNVQNLDMIGNLINAAVVLGGILRVDHILQLQAPLRSACHELFVHSHHQLHRTRHPQATAGNRSLHTGSGQAAIFIPLAGDDDLQSSGLLDSIQTPFRPVALVLPSIQYYIESLLLLEGFAPSQLSNLQVSAFFVGLAAAEMELSGSLSCYRLASSVVKEARRIRVSFRAVSCVSDVPLAAQLSFSPRRHSSTGLGINNSSSSDQFNAAIEQSIFKNAIENIVLPVLNQYGNSTLTRRYQDLVQRCFQLVASHRMVADTLKGCSREEVLAGALSICAEHFGLATSAAQISISMEIWRALQNNQAIIVYGSPGSGKSTCVKTLHHALCALEFADLQVDKDEEQSPSDFLSSKIGQTSDLVVLNPSLFSLEELYGLPASTSKRHENIGLLNKIFSSASSPTCEDAYSTQLRTWVLLDGGALDSLWLEPLLGLFSESDRWLNLLDGCRIKIPHNVSNRVRLIFEVLDLRDLSPSLLADCWSAYVPFTLISHLEIIHAWRDSWEKRVASFPVASKASSNVATLFATVDLLISTVCVKFVAEEMEMRSDVKGGSSTSNHEDEAQDSQPRELRLGFLSVNHMTQTALKLVASLCLEHRANLEELSHAQVSLLVCFSVAWGFSGHLSDQLKHKLEHFIRSHAKGFAELNYLCDLPGTIFSGDHFGSVWDTLQPLQYRPGLSIAEKPGLSDEGASEQIVYDPSSAQFVVIAPSARILVRICSQLIRSSSQSFLFTGGSAAGKTSLLRLLRRLNEDDEAAEVMVDASIDQGQSHGILNWLKMPAAWFSPALAALDSQGARSKFKEESELFAPRTTYSTIFLDDLGANVKAGDVGPQEEFVRLLLDHQVAFSRKDQRFVPLDKDIGAAMRVEETWSSSTSTELSASLARLMRHFTVFQVPNYDRKQLLSIFKAKFQTHFLSATMSRSPPSGDGTQTPSTHHDSGDRLLTMEETALRASIDLAVELNAIQSAVQISQDADAADAGYLVFNLHHLSALLKRTLAFASSLREKERSTSLLSLGKLHQSWMSEIRNMFLANYSTLGSPGTDSHRRKSSKVSAKFPGDPANDNVVKIRSALRLISEKYFSVSLCDDPQVLASIEVVYFTLQLASKYPQLSVVEPLVKLREIMTSNASASSSSSTRNRSTNSNNNNSNTLGTASRESTSGTIQRILVQLASSASWSSSSPPARSYGKPEDLSLEVKLLMGSSYGLNKTLHLLHALDEQRHLLISTQDSRAVVESLLRFACDSHGLQVKRISFMRDHGGLDEKLRAFLHSAVIQNERIALWVECDDKNMRFDDSQVLLDLIKELCLNQIPSLLFRSGELRDAAVLSFVQSQSELEMATDEEILSDFVDRVQRNLRLCIFIGSNCRHNETPQQSVFTLKLLDWVRSRERFQWFCFERIESLDQVLTEIAEVAVKETQIQLSSVITEISTSDAANATTDAASCVASLCHRIHVKLTVESMVVEMSEYFQLTYYLSFLKNFVVLYQRNRKTLETRVTRHQEVLDTLQATHRLGVTLEARMNLLAARLSQLRDARVVAAEAAEEHQIHLRQERLRHIKDQDEDEAHDDKQVRKMALDATHTFWVHRSHCEEIALMITELETEHDEIATRLKEWSEVASTKTEFVTKWGHNLENMRASQTLITLLADALLQSALMAYSYVASLPVPKLNAYIASIKHMLADLYQETSSLSSISSTTEDHSRTHHKSPGDDAYAGGDMGLSRLLWGARFRFLRQSNVFDTVCLADNLCDRLPVFVDQSGILQRFFIHFFSGHSLFSSASDDKEAKKQAVVAMVIMCEDEMLEAKLHEAQRRNLPVLLINFELQQTLPKLLPFLEHQSGHKRQPAFSQLTMGSYHTHLAELEAKKKKKKSRQPSLSLAVESLAAKLAFSQVSANQSGGSNKVGSHVRKRFEAIGALSTEMAAAAVAEAASASMDDKNASQQPKASNASSSTSTAVHRQQGQRTRGSGFQLYAVTPTPIQIQEQHALAMYLAVFQLNMGTEALEAFFHEVWIRKCDSKLHHEVRELEATQVESVHRCLQLETRLHELLLSQPPKAATFFKTNSIPWIRFFFQHYQQVPGSFTELDKDKRRHRSQRFLVNERREEIAKETNKYKWIANQFAGIAGSMTAVSTLAGTSSQIYARTYRWLEFAIERQLDLLDVRHQSSLELVVDQSEMARSIVVEIVQQLISGFASKSHRQIFLFLLTVEREAQRSEQLSAQCGHHNDQVTPQVGTRSAYKHAVQLLSSARGKRSGETTEQHGHPRSLVTSASASVTEAQQSEGSSGAGFSSSQTKSQSMVDRLRRRVRLCALVFDSLSKASGATNNQQGLARPHSLYAGVIGINDLQTRTSKSSKKDPATGNPASSSALSSHKANFKERAQKMLSDLLISVETHWGNWKQGKMQSTTDLQCVLNSLGIQRSRLLRRKSVGVSDALVQVSNLMSLVDRDDVYGEYAVASVAKELEASDPMCFEKQMGRLLITKMHFPDLFADAMDAYIDDQTAVEDRAMISFGVPLPLTQSLLPKDSKRGQSCTLAAAAALVGDIAPLRGIDRVHLPNSIVVYDLHERNRTELLLSSWTQTSSRLLTVHHYDDASLRSRLTPLVTSKDKFVVEVLTASHCERLISLISQLINQHALLSIPEWYIVVSLSIASRIQSSLLPLIPKLVIARLRSHTNSDSHSDQDGDMKRWLVNRGVSELFADKWVRLELGNSRATAGHIDEGVSIPVLTRLKDLVVQFRAIEDSTAAGELEREGLENALIELTTTGKAQLTAFRDSKHQSELVRKPDATVFPSGEPSKSTAEGSSSVAELPRDPGARSATNRASFSAELLSDLLLLRRSMALSAPGVMFVRDCAAPPEACGKITAASTRDLVIQDEDTEIRIPKRMDELCHQITSLYWMLREEVAALSLSGLLSSSSFFPWMTLVEEFEEHFRAFASVNKCFQALKAQLLHPRDGRGFISIYAQQQITSLANGVIPFEWMELAFTHTVGPSTTISIPQLVLLVACRLGMLLNYLCGEPLVAVNLAVLSDARRFLRAMKTYCAKQWSTSVDNVVLVLEIEPQHDSQADESAESETSSVQQQHKQRRPAIEHYRALGTAIITDASGFPCGFLVDGLVVIEQSDTSAKANQTNLYPLPLCRLYCAIESDLVEIERQEAEAAQPKKKNADGSSKPDEKPSADQDAGSDATRSVSLLMLPSLSPYQQPPHLLDQTGHENDNSATLDTSLRLRFPLATVIPALGVSRRDQRPDFAFAIGAPMFPDDDDVEVV